MSITREQYEEAVRQKDAAQATINQYFAEKRGVDSARLKSTEPFTEDELLYSATVRCKCGAGLAYPKDNVAASAWICSAILKTNPAMVQELEDEHHIAALPFAFYEIKAEGQPSAQGATTRPEVVG